MDLYRRINSRKLIFSKNKMAGAVNIKVGGYAQTSIIVNLK